MARQKWADLPSRRNNPDSQTVDPAEYGISGILQFGRCQVRTTRGTAYGLHAHDCYQLTICTRGMMTFTGAKNETWTLLPGRMLVMPPGVLHKLRSNTRGVMRYWLFLPRSPGGEGVLGGLSPGESAWLDRRIRRLAAGVYSMPETATRLLGRMFDVLGDASCRRPEKALRLRSMMLDLFIAAVDAKRCADSGDDVMRPIAARMVRAPERAYPMDALVSETRLSPTTILNQFRRETGKTPHQYLMACRIRKAVDLLSHTHRKVTDIALSLGFASSQHFAASFRREMGMTPRQWRRKMVKKHNVVF
ncbi:MAG: helix-turn-helix domain-containing protein [Kiritimatiellae bacterium]|nr:helix-turn-helix domain-containing protein [Kiritimatiellia bacterium]MBQ3344932.1 helix-turn-helix domain-containing protein [Kiritimatiellia bacterium]